MAVLGDRFGDGGVHLLIGATGRNGALSNEGAVYLTDATSTTGPVGDADCIKGNGASSEFGAAVAGAGDVDGNGFPDILLGAPLADSDNSGVAALFLAPHETEDVDEADLFVLGNAADGVGNAVASAGDWSGDGLPEWVVTVASQSAVGVFDATMRGTIGIEDALHLAVGPVGSDAGIAVATEADLDGDGYRDLVIGAPGDNTGGAHAGAVYVVHGGDTLASISLATDADAIWIANPGDSGGASVATGGDVDADGTPDLAIGAPTSAANGVDSGSVWLVTSPSGGLSMLADASRALLVGDAVYDEAGNSVAFVGDIDHDGFDDLAVGAWRSSQGGSGAGATYLLFGVD
jgi:hypothetical protein